MSGRKLRGNHQRMGSREFSVPQSSPKQRLPAAEVAVVSVERPLRELPRRGAPRLHTRAESIASMRTVMTRESQTEYAASQAYADDHGTCHPPPDAEDVQPADAVA